MKKLLLAVLAVVIAITAVMATKRAEPCPCDFAFRFVGPPNPTAADVVNPLYWVQVDCQYFVQCPTKEVACGICVNRANIQTIGGALHPIKIFTAVQVPPFNAAVTGVSGPYAVLAAYNRKPQ